MQETQRKPKFRHAQVVKLARLLDMLYKPAEIAEEIDVTPDTVYRSYLPAGCPHQRDRKNNIWIPGLAFADWARATLANRKAKRQPLPEGQAWCLRCNKAVPLVNPKAKRANRYIQLLQAKCPHCGTTINRAISSKHPTEAPRKGREEK